MPKPVLRQPMPATAGMTRTALLAVTLLPLLAFPTPPAAAQAQPGDGGAQWPERFYNPRPDDGDLVLPGPCGAAMAFRRVETATGPNRLSDIRLRMGQSQTDSKFEDFRRFGFVAGGYTDEKDSGRRFYYIGKYEVTHGQFDAVMAAAAGTNCDKPTRDATVAKDNASWYDAVDFTRRYNSYLYAQALDRLPREDGQPGFVRLPTEEEWSYAARGGHAVPQSQLGNALFDPARSVSDYAWHAGGQSCNGYTQYVGDPAIRPNPVGLFDVLGNVQEIVLDSYRMHAPGRAHGQAGGFIVRGGNCMTAARSLSTALRHEETLFDRNSRDERRPPYTGFRIVIVPPVITSQARIGDILEDWEAARALRTPQTDRPSDRLRAIAKSSADADIARDMEDLAADFDSEMRRRNEIEARSVRAMIEAAAAQIRTFIDYDSRIAVAEGVLKAGGRNTPATRSFIEKSRARQSYTRELYLSMVRRTGDDFSDKTLDAQLPQVLSDLEHQPSPVMRDYARLFVSHVRRYRESGGIGGMVADMRDIAQTQREE